MTNWKIVAVVFIVLFVLETAYIVWAVSIYQQEQKNTAICYYDICEEYPDAAYGNGVCRCYKPNQYGVYSVVKTEVIK
jgi:hypothetical protein